MTYRLKKVPQFQITPNIMPLKDVKNMDVRDRLGLEKGSSCTFKINILQFDIMVYYSIEASSLKKKCILTLRT